MPDTDTSELLERERELSMLGECLEGVRRSSRGRLVFVAGEAGAGKTALLRRFCEAGADGARVLWGACDALFTPRPLGPLVDIAESTAGELAEAVESGGATFEVAAALIGELRRRPPTILVLEDAHWADDATLDCLRLVARRAGSLPAALLVSYRATELTRFHPLRQVLGELGSQASSLRLKIAPLSPEGVARLAESHGVDGAALHMRTGGNPFFVTEVLAAGEDMPDTVRDAVLARAARLTPPARALLDAVAIAPTHSELSVLEQSAPDALPALDECLASGMLVETGGGVAFRHELARLAVEEAAAPDEKLRLHRSTLATLRGLPGATRDLARLAHHAEEARDTDAVIEFAPAAGGRACALGSHREAAAQYARALRFADGLPPPERAELLRLHTGECYVTTLDDDALASSREALDVWTQLGVPLGQAAALADVSRVSLNLGLAQDAIDAAGAAASLLEEMPPGPFLAAVYGLMGGVHLLSEDRAETERWSRRALDLASELDLPETMASAHAVLGAAAALQGLPSGIEELERSLELAQKLPHGADLVGRTHVFLAMAGCRARSLDFMDRHVEVGLAYCEEQDIAVWARFLLATRSWVALERGDWDRAAETVELVLMKDCKMSCLQARVVLALVRARRGDPDPWTPLGEARAVAERTGQLWWMWQVAAAEAEALWLAGRAEAIADATAETFELAVRLGSPWCVAELAWWRRQGGIRGPVPAEARGPFEVQLRGDWSGAEAAWRDAGCPYEAALALAESGDEAALRTALEELQELGARPAAAMVARRLREGGATGVPRGPRPRTRENEANLTPRQVEVLALLSEGLRNAEIAERLFLSEKTVHHHVSAILSKLDVQSRGQAAAEAVRLGIAGRT
jgi:DNA-binding CsgD family transcriptional regulator/tetratricopeptide (TPR) repeat protein